MITLNPAITVKPLTRDQYPQMAEWEYGPQPANTDWAAYAREIEHPRWTHFAVYLAGIFCAAVSLEQIGSTVRFHVVKEPDALRPDDLADLLIMIGDYLFQNGIEELEAIAPTGYRASNRLALRTGMSYRGPTDDGARFSITKAEFEQQHYASDQPLQRMA